MPDFNPKEMDALFREGAERHEFEYNPDAWALLEDKLDRKDRKRRFFFFLLGGSLLILGLIIFMYWNVSSTDSKEAYAATEIETYIGEQEYKDQPSIQNNSGDTKDLIQTDVTEQKRTLTNETLSETPTSSTKEYILSNSKESGDNIGAQYSILSENTGNLMSNEIVSIDSPIETEVEMTPLNSDNGTDQVVNIPNTGKEFTNETIIQNFKKPVLKAEKIIGITITPIEQNTIQFPNLDVVVNETPSIIPPLKNRFALSLFANPEWSSVGLFGDSKTGWSFGTKAAYQFADKFEFSLGIAYSRKIYKGGGEAYVMEGGWFNDIEPERMDAKCDVIEIPVALSYHFNGFRNSGFFADIGINSYMLHSEWYGFEYDDALIRPQQYEEVNEASENSHLIGVGRIAVGYQNVLSNKATIQIAPYLQFPLTGIGAGKVNVYSSGIQLAVKFNTQ